jgi:hypothetical protein
MSLVSVVANLQYIIEATHLLVCSEVLYNDYNHHVELEFSPNLPITIIGIE